MRVFTGATYVPEFLSSVPMHRGLTLKSIKGPDVSEGDPPRGTPELSKTSLFQGVPSVETDGLEFQFPLAEVLYLLDQVDSVMNLLEF